MKSALGMLRKLEPRKKGIRDYSQEPVQQTGVNRRKYISFESVFGQEAVLRKEINWLQMQADKKIKAAQAETAKERKEKEEFLALAAKAKKDKEEIEALIAKEKKEKEEAQALIAKEKKQAAESNRRLQQASLASFDQGIPLQNLADAFQKTPEEIEQIINE